MGGRNKFCAAIGNWYMRWDFPELSFYADPNCSDPISTELVGSLSTACSAKMSGGWFDPVRDDDDFNDDAHPLRTFVRNSLTSVVFAPGADQVVSPLTLEASISLSGLSLATVQAAEGDYALLLAQTVAQVTGLPSETLQVTGFTALAASLALQTGGEVIVCLVLIAVEDYVALGYSSPEETQFFVQQALQGSVADGSFTNTLGVLSQAAGLSIQGTTATSATVADPEVDKNDDHGSADADGSTFALQWVIIIAAGGGTLLLIAVASTIYFYLASRHRPVSSTLAPAVAPQSPEATAPVLPLDTAESQVETTVSTDSRTLSSAVAVPNPATIIATVPHIVTPDEDRTEALVTDTTVAHSTSAVSLSGVSAAL